jgi:hypothetical protein
VIGLLETVQCTLWFSSNEPRIELAGPAFIVMDPWGERVNTYPTEDAAKQDIERCKREDAMWETAKLLVDTAIKAHMQMHGVDRETARRLIRDAAEVAD